VGQNAVWLAQHGFSVDAVDISPVALEHGRQAAARAGVDVNFIQADLDGWTPRADAYDLVIGFRFLYRPLWPHLQAALRLGGWLVYSTFNIRKRVSAAGLPLGYLLHPGELAHTFSAWDILQAGDGESGARDQSWIICRKTNCNPLGNWYNPLPQG